MRDYLPEWLKDSKLVYEDSHFEVFDNDCRMYLYSKGGREVGELIEGEEAFKRYYKGDYKVWIAAMHKKDMKRMDKIHQLIGDLQDEGEYRLETWDGYEF